MITTVSNYLSILLMVAIIIPIIMIYKKRVSFLNGIFLGTSLFLISFGCSVMSENILYGQSVIDATINNTFSSMIYAYENAVQISEEQLFLIKQIIEIMRNVYFAMFPTILVCTYLIASFAIIMLAKGVLALFKRDVSGFGRFCDFKMSRLGIILGIAAYLLSTILKGNQLSFAFLNFSAIIVFATYICGFSAFDFVFRKKVKNWFLRLIIYISIMLLSVIFVGFSFGILLAFGLYDAFFDIRNPKIKPDDLN